VGAGAATIRGGSAVTAGAAGRAWPSGVAGRLTGARVATTGRESMASGGRAVLPPAATKLEASGLIRSGPWIGSIRRTSGWAIRASWMGRPPKLSWGTATTAFCTLTFL
jgi:hypothetical protein